MFSKILKDSAASVKAWQSRTRAVNFTDENFKNWFGDSKLVNPDGSPMPLYHGTPGADISQMKMSKDGALGAGVYLTPDASFASTYADASNLVRDKEIDNNVASGPGVLKLYAAIRKPLVIHTEMNKNQTDPMVDALVILGMTRPKAQSMAEKIYEDKGYFGKEVMSRAQKQGYDGIMQYRFGKLAEVVAFSPQQVKSAISNEGTYYRGLPHIQKEETMFSTILKTSAGAIKAWKTRQRNAKATKLGIIRTSVNPPKAAPKAAAKPATTGKISYGEKVGQNGDTKLYDGDASHVRTQLKKSGYKKEPAGGYEKWSNGKEMVMLNPDGLQWTVARKPIAAAQPAKTTTKPAKPVAKKWPDPVPSPKDRLSPEAPPEHKAKMQEYMAGYSSKLKNPKEKAYVEARVTQMIAGIPRPSGMSAKYGLTKQRAVQYEILNQKIFTSGRLKHNI